MEVKKCAKCDLEYELWYFQSKRSDCPKCRAKEDKQRKVEIQDIIRKIKSIRGCLQCLEKNPVCLEFHHPIPRNENELTVAGAITRRWSLDKVLAEIDKCVIYCANCHLKHHANKE